MARVVRITTGSRLHFGLMSLAGGDRAFAGVGAMLEAPQLVLEARESAGFSILGEHATRILTAASRWQSELQLKELPHCDLVPVVVPPQHTGLGVGTQLALATVAALEAFADLPPLGAAELAACSGRGKRSAVGTHGFMLGGLIVDGGKSGAALGDLDCRIDLPSEWRFVLLCPRAQPGLAGEEESRAMASLPQVASSTTDMLIREANEQLIPSAATHDFSTFAASLYRYGNIAGSFFASIQQGNYNGPLLTAWVEWLRENGCEGVVQSSWGPTLAVVMPSEERAADLCEKVRSCIAHQQAPSELASLIMSRPRNTGASIEIFSP